MIYLGNSTVNFISGNIIVLKNVSFIFMWVRKNIYEHSFECNVLDHVSSSRSSISIPPAYIHLIYISLLNKRPMMNFKEGKNDYDPCQPSTFQDSGYSVDYSFMLKRQFPFYFIVKSDSIALWKESGCRIISRGHLIIQQKWCLLIHK